jgi:hypothetical protein
MCVCLVFKELNLVVETGQYEVEMQYDMKWRETFLF